MKPSKCLRLPHVLVCFALATLAGPAPADAQFTGCPITGSWSGTFGGVLYVGHYAEEPDGTITGVSYPVDDPANATPAAGTRTGTNVLLPGDPFDNVGTMVSCDQIDYVIVPIGLTYTAHRQRNTYCGDGVTQAPDESCDDGNFENGDACTVSCQPPPPAVCGNGVVEHPEQCDDGNLVQGDGCSNDCASNVCGNTVVESGEQCDDGNLVDGDGCSALCQSNVCGNAVLEPGEQCDPGDADDGDGDGCTALCQYEGCPVSGSWTTTIGSTTWLLSLEEGLNGAFTGVSFVAGAPGSAAQGSGTRTGGSLTSTFAGQPFTHVGTMVDCDTIEGEIQPVSIQYVAHRVRATYCGDGVTQDEHGEGCDDDNFSNGDDCLVSCVPAGCGDGIVSGTEQCDDGNVVGGDGCSAGCVLQVCGNLVEDPGEDCDDGNLVDGDGCSATCRPNVCGNAVIEPGEECDPGDADDGDADRCSALCQFEGCPFTGTWTARLGGTTYVGYAVEDASGLITGNSMVEGSPMTVLPSSGARNGSALTLTYGPPYTHVGEMKSCDEVRFTIEPLGVGYTSTRVRDTYCGDGAQQPAYEACDDGNFGNADACSAGCTTSAGCGDAIVGPGEACDDGNGLGTDACKPDCTANVCGDGFVHIGVERCDHGGAGAGSGCAADCSALEPEVADDGNGGGVPVGGFTLSVTTDGENDGATLSDPVETTVHVPPGTTAGTVKIVETPAPPASPPGFAFMGTLIDITVENLVPAPSASTPLRLELTLDSSQLLPGQTAATIEIRKDGAPVAPCTGPVGVAVPDPCVSERATLQDGDVRISVLTSSASDWSSIGNVCGDAPAIGCRPAAAGKSSLALTEKGAKDTLRWTWKGATSVVLGAFGQPVSSSDQTLCLYDATGLRAFVTAPAAGDCAGKPCWKALPKGKGFSYSDKEKSPDGVARLVLKPGAAGKSSVTLSASGPALTVPPTALSLPIVAQLRSADGACFEAYYSTTKRNETGKVVAKSD